VVAIALVIDELEKKILAFHHIIITGTITRTTNTIIKGNQNE